MLVDHELLEKVQTHSTGYNQIRVVCERIGVHEYFDEAPPCKCMRFVQVWEIQRAENVRRTAELVDGLRVQSTLFAISEGGEMFWKQMQIKQVATRRRPIDRRGLDILASSMGAAFHA